MIEKEIYKTPSCDLLAGEFFYVIEDWHLRGYPKENYLCINLSKSIVAIDRGIYPATLHHKITARYGINPYKIPCTLQVMSTGMLCPIHVDFEKAAPRLWSQILSLKVHCPYLFK